MELTIKSGNPEKQRAACLVIGVFESRRFSPMAKKLDELSDGYLNKIMKGGDLEGKLGQSLLLHNVPGTSYDRILCIGCGQEKDLGDSQFREIVNKMLAKLHETGAIEALNFLTELKVKNRDISWKVRQIAILSLNSIYRFDQCKSKKSPRRALRRLIIQVPTRAEFAASEVALEQGIAIAKGMAMTRDLANLPPNICTPTYLAKEARSLAKKHSKISVSILNEKDMKNLNMGLLLSVTQGSKEPAKLITLEYRGGLKKTKPIVFVGKGITFDTGGNSLKPALNMVGMKYDMSGGAALFGMLEAIALLNLPINVVCVIPTCENMPGGTASRPDDIVTSMSGLTVEILNTDAEGRLILADALTYCERYEPEIVVDIATLTGACIVALGHAASGLMSNSAQLAQKLLKAGNESFDRVWELPIWDDYQESLKTPFADTANIGAPGVAGTIIGACFLSKFTKKYQWAHLDIAGTACAYSGDNRGSTGRPVPLLVQFLIDCVKNQDK